MFPFRGLAVVVVRLSIQSWFVTFVSLSERLNMYS